MQKRQKKRPGTRGIARTLLCLLLVAVISGAPFGAVRGAAAQTETSDASEGAAQPKKIGGKKISGKKISSKQTGGETEEDLDPLAERMQAAKGEIRTKSVGSYGMLPVYGRDIADGSYPIEAESSSPFFHVTDAQLMVEGEALSVTFTIPSASYSHVFAGSALEAADAAEADRIPGSEQGGKTVFTLPIEALDAGQPCAAFSVRRQLWYDRTLVFRADSLPPEALSVTLPDYEVIEAAIRSYDTTGAGADAAAAAKEPEAVRVGVPDGEYSIEVGMTGGSGRASISSPTLLTVRDGQAYATLLWSSAYYDYMLLDGAFYENQTADGGNSTFEIPITVMDEGISVIADTTAMGDPVEIQYVLTFYEESIADKGLIPQEAAKKVLLIALAVMIAGGILNYFVKRGRK